MKKFALSAAAFAAHSILLAAGAHVVQTSGEGDSRPEDYVPPVIGNGSICTSIDNLGKQIQRKYVTYFPEVVWAGRRTSLPGTSLITMGHFDDEISVDGAPLGRPLKWRQSLNTTEAFTECEAEYETATVKTVAFVPYGYDMLVVKKTVLPKSKSAKSAEIKFSYKFTDKDTGNPPYRTIMRAPKYKKIPNSASPMSLRPLYFESVFSEKPSERR